jgi:hypothetical protein
LRHVDVVKNEWLAGFQYAVARVTVEASQIHVDTGEPDVWIQIVLRPFIDEETGEMLHAQKDPDTFFNALPRAIHGTYLFATPPHEDAECHFDRTPVVAIEPLQREAV